MFTQQNAAIHGASGGQTTVSRHGTMHMQRLGKAGYDGCVASVGKLRCYEIIRGKGWQGPRKAGLPQDLALGRLLAERYG